MTSPERTEVLEHVYRDLVSERDRLRNARAGLTSRLGPLPASAAIVIGLAGTAAGKVHSVWILEAAGLLALLMSISTVYSGLRPYRLLRARHQQHFDPGRAEAATGLGFGINAQNRETWLNQKIKLEQALCGPLQIRQGFSLSLRAHSLQKALDVERSAFALVQLLFVEIVAVLVTGLAMRDVAVHVQKVVASWIALATVVALVVAVLFGHWSDRRSSAGR
jgi:hypothetical protein